jgi:hypothetical protein
MLMVFLSCLKKMQGITPKWLISKKNPLCAEIGGHYLLLWVICIGIASFSSVVKKIARDSPYLAHLQNVFPNSDASLPLFDSFVFLFRLAG